MSRHRFRLAAALRCHRRRDRHAGAGRGRRPAAARGVPARRRLLRHRRHLHPRRGLARRRLRRRRRDRVPVAFGQVLHQGRQGDRLSGDRADQGLQDPGRRRPGLHRGRRPPPEAARARKRRWQAGRPAAVLHERAGGGVTLRCTSLSCPIRRLMLSPLSFHSQSPAIALLASEPARAFFDLVASRGRTRPLAKATAIGSSSIRASVRAPGAPGGCARRLTPPASTSSTGASA